MYSKNKENILANTDDNQELRRTHRFRSQKINEIDEEKLELEQKKCNKKKYKVENETRKVNNLIQIRSSKSVLFNIGANLSNKKISHYNQELLPEILATGGVVYLKHLAERTLADSGVCPNNIETEREADLTYNEYECAEQHNCLQAVTPDNSTYAALPCVKPDKQDDNGYRNRKRQTIAVQKDTLQDEADKIQADAGPCKFTQQKESGSRPTGHAIEALLQIAVDTSQVQPIIYRKQDRGYHNIAKHEA